MLTSEAQSFINETSFHLRITIVIFYFCSIRVFKCVASYGKIMYLKLKNNQINEDKAFLSSVRKTFVLRIRLQMATVSRYPVSNVFWAPSGVTFHGVGLNIAGMWRHAPSDASAHTNSRISMCYQLLINTFTRYNSTHINSAREHVLVSRLSGLVFRILTCDPRMLE